MKFQLEHKVEYVNSRKTPSPHQVKVMGKRNRTYENPDHKGALIETIVVVVGRNIGRYVGI